MPARVPSWEGAVRVRRFGFNLSGLIIKLEFLSELYSAKTRFDLHYIDKLLSHFTKSCLNKELEAKGGD